MRQNVWECRCDVIDPTDDSDLAEALHLAAGDAFPILFRRYARLVHRVAANILRDSGEAEDVTQEVFLELYQKAHLYDPARGSFKVWVLQYAYHRSLRRKNALRLRVAYGSERLDGAQHPDGESLRALTRQECEWVIKAGLAQLSKKQRATLEMTCFEGLVLREVAERLGVSLGCARHHYYRGLARLRAWALESEASTAGAAHCGVWTEGASVQKTRRGAPRLTRGRVAPFRMPVRTSVASEVSTLSPDDYDERLSDTNARPKARPA